MKAFILSSRVTLNTALLSGLAAAALTVTSALSPTKGAPDNPALSTPAPVATPQSAPAIIPPPQAQAYVRVRPGLQIIEGRTLAPASFLQNELGVSVETLVAGQHYRFSFFEKTLEVWNEQRGALFNGEQGQLPVAARLIGDHLYVPWVPVAELFGFRWSRPDAADEGDGSTLLLLQYPAAYIENIRHSVADGKVRVVMDLSNATRVTARLAGGGVQLNLAAARRPTVPSVEAIGDIAVPNAVTTSGNWQAKTQIKLNYAAPISWHTLSDPPRIVVDVQKIFEQSDSESLSAGLSFTKVFRGTGHGPVRMFVAIIDPRKGWRVRVTPAGYSVLQRQRTSRIASRSKAPLAINGGFFALDGAAVGAVKVGNEWIRLPWKGRTAIGFNSDGRVKIDNLQVQAHVVFSSGLKLPIRDLNGWPDKNRITAVTRRFATTCKLRPGEIAVVVENGVVTKMPGSGAVSVPKNGFVLVANGGARPELLNARRGLKATLKINAPAWNDYTSALGGGPRLVENGRAQVREEGFRSDVTNGLGPRTAIGVDKHGRYIVLVADGRQGYYSTGLTLQELAYTMQKFGAVHALNLDGGGSAAMAIRGKIINRPSDGSERRVSNALLVMR